MIPTIGERMERNNCTDQTEHDIASHNFSINIATKFEP